MLKVIGGVPDGEYKAIASGSLPNGKPVVVNSDGTVSVVASSEVSGVIGSTATYYAGETRFTATVGASDNKVIIIYRDGNNGDYITYVVGTVSGTSITFGSSGVISTSYTPQTEDMSAAYNPSTDTVVVHWSTNDNSYSSVAAAGTLSGTSITWGSVVQVYQVGSNVNRFPTVSYDSGNDKFVFGYGDSSGRGVAAVGSVSGTTITLGDAGYFASSNNTLVGATLASTYDSSSGKIVFTYPNYSSSQYGTAVVGTVSGTDITFGTPVVYESANCAEQDVTYDSVNNKIVTVYRDGGNSLQFTYAVGEVSGTSITFGTPALIASKRFDKVKCVFNSTTGKVTAIGKDSGGADYPDLFVGEVSGTTATWGSETSVASVAVNYLQIASTGSVVVPVYTQPSTSDYGRAIVYQSDYTSTNITAENYIGMSRGVVESTGSPASIGSSVTYAAAQTFSKAAVYDANAQKVVIAYNDNANSGYGTAIVGTVSGTSISFGTEVVFDANTITMPYKMVYDPDSQKVVIAYRNGGTTQGKAVVGTVSGTSISFGSVATFTTSDARGINMIYDTVNDRVVVPYMDFSNSNYGTAAVGTVSGTSISFGTPVVFQSENTSSGAIGAAFDTSNGKTVFTYIRRSDSDSGYAIVGTVSGTSISFGTAVKFNDGETYYNACDYDSNAGKILAVFADYQDGSAPTGKGIVGTVSGTSISFGTAAQFFGDYPIYINTEYDSTAQQTLIIFRDNNGANQYSNIVQGTISGTSVTFNDPLEISIKANSYMDLAYDPDQNKTVVAIADINDGYFGKSFVYTADTETTNRYPVADGDPARLDIIGSVSENQLSLTAGEKYYVQNDGTLSTTAGSPSVLAGTAISATKLVVKT